MMDLQVSCDSFRTKPSFINRKVVTRLDTYDVIVFNEQVHAALHCAIWTVGRHDAIDHTIRAPATMRGVVQMRPIFLNDLLEMFDSTHEFFCRFVYTIPRMMRLQRGQ